MSRNFELLQRTEKERELNSETASQIQPELSHLDLTKTAGSSRLPTLNMDEASRGELNKLVKRLFILPGASRVVAFCGVEPSAGCSWITARAAETLAAQVSASVCVVDANFCSPALHHFFAVENNRGLRDAVLQLDPVKSFTQRLQLENLWVMTSGSAATDREVLISSSAFRLRVAELCREFDYVLFDTPALSLYSDAISLAHVADGVALVIGANSTRRETAKKVAQDLDNASVRLLGAVLNKRTFAIPDLIYQKLHYLTAK